MITNILFNNNKLGSNREIRNNSVNELLELMFLNPHNYNSVESNFYSNDKEYGFEFNLAGYDKNEISLTINENNLLKIEAVKKIEETNSNDANVNDDKGLDKVYHYKNILTSSVSQNIKLPKNADKNSVTTKFENGILTVVLQKVVETSPNVIKIDIK